MAVRIPFDSLTLHAVAGELRESLAGGMVQRVTQPTDTELLLAVRGAGATRTLLLSWHATWARAHLTVVRRANPATPPTFCMICRKYLEGGRVVSVAQRGFDRILDIEIAHAEGRYVLAAELMGKHSNVLLLSEAGTILDAGKHITKRLSRHRETLPGKPYVPPPAQEDRLNPLALSTAEVKAFAEALPAEPEARTARLMGRLEGISPFLAEELLRRAESSSFEEAWEGLFGAAARGAWRPVVIRNERGEPVGAYPFASVQFPARDQHERESMNVALDQFTSVAIPRGAADAARHELATMIERALKARRKQADSTRRSLEEAGKAEQYREAGEMILANLWAIDPEADRVTVQDYYAADGGERTLALDPEKSARDNAEGYFRRYKKAKEGLDRHRAQLEKAEEDLLALESARLMLEEARDVEAVKTLREGLIAEGRLRPVTQGEGADADRRAPDFGGKKIRTFQTPEGWEILVGENSEANDYLTAKVASPNDYWLHVRANSSAHVVIRTKNQPDAVPHGVLQQAALLAARHSPAKHSSLVPVDYTLKKHVRRPRGSASGAAFYQNERTIYVSPKE